MTQITRYRAPAAASAMASMLLSPDAIADIVARSHETMQAEVQRLLTAQDRARRLLLAMDDFAEAWRTEPAEGDGGPIDVMSDAIAAAVAMIDIYSMSPWPTAVLHDYLLRLAEADIAHPLVLHREVLRAACTALGQSAPDWADIDEYVASRQLLDAGPQIGQPCTFYAADGSAPRAAVVAHVWGPSMVNLEWQEQGAPAYATSVRVLRVPEPDTRYYCVLEPMPAAG